MDKNKECYCSNCDVCKINLEFEQEKEKIIKKYFNELDKNFWNYKEVEECKKIINDSIKYSILRLGKLNNCFNFAENSWYL